MQITLSNDLQLELQPVSQVAVDEIIGEMGGYAEMARQAAMPRPELREYWGGLSIEEIEKRRKAQRKQMLYLFGWGVKDAVPPAMVAVLDALDCNSDIQQIQRANWLIYAAGITRADKSLIIGTVMALTRTTQ